ncbi:uncharacterized protein LOC106176328 [Lingula anatina]|uniref:Uncharacterized protein LOC106176328 n=1 Tax=Lingula anatina TaxID=7574 RepID=A0A1S3JUW6_LINAN|nr:uncharacterized protein LOC106176328 [Lingula anatina]|eukprot:XP_013414118.1 uncharacterized protein LOC106176328 [Lingula anatina]
MGNEDKEFAQAPSVPKQRALTKKLATYTITLEDIEGGSTAAEQAAKLKKLPDGDLIKVDKKENACYPNQIGYRLKLGSNVHWRKELKLVEDTMQKPDIQLCRCQDDRREHEVYVKADLFETHQLILCKAKTLGVTKPVYLIQDAPEKIRGGTFITFEWIKDLKDTCISSIKLCPMWRDKIAKKIIILLKR